MRPANNRTVKIADTPKRGFSIIEIMIVLSITALMLVGFMATTSSQINHQRERDAVQDFASWLQTQISEVLYPQDSGNIPSNQVIWGRLITYRGGGLGSMTARPLTGPAGDTIPAELTARHGHHMVTYNPKWQSELRVMTDDGPGVNRNAHGIWIVIVRNPSASEIQLISVENNNAVPEQHNPPISTGSGGNPNNFSGFCLRLGGNNWTTIAFDTATALADDEVTTGGEGMAGTGMVRILNRDTGGNICQ